MSEKRDSGFGQCRSFGLYRVYLLAFRLAMSLGVKVIEVEREI